jgi:hypothetical protein
MATTEPASGAARESTIIDRPRKLPISTIWPPAGTRPAAVHSRPPWAWVIHPSTDSVSAHVSSKPAGVSYVIVGYSGGSPGVI